MDLRCMDKIIEINTDSGYAVIEPGVTLDQFAVALAPERIYYHLTEDGIEAVEQL